MYLLDTNILSELRKIRTGRANRDLRHWAESVDAPALFLSVISIQEVQCAIAQVRSYDLPQALNLTRWLEEQVVPAFGNRILPVDVPVARRSGELQTPTTRPFHDSLIAATAYVHDFTLVTRNVGDFAGTGIRVLNPFEASPRSILP